MVLPWDGLGDVDLVLFLGARFRGLVTTVPSASLVDLFRVSRLPRPGPPASSSFFACRAICLASKSGLVKTTAHLGHVSCPLPWLRACLRRCSALVKLCAKVNFSIQCSTYLDLPFATTSGLTGETLQGSGDG